MRKAYQEFVCQLLRKAEVAKPIYTNQIASGIAAAYGIAEKDAAAATAVAVKRIMDGGIVPELRCYQKGVYYRTVVTPFGEMGIDKEQLIADKYLLPDIGYETGLLVLHRMGLTTQMPKDLVLATNMARDCARTDKRLGVVIRPPKIKITAENKAYLQMLDVLDVMGHAPIDQGQPYVVLADYIQKQELQYGVLLGIADRYYNQNTVLRLARTAGAGDVEI